jgi:hypothetical protein
VSTNFTNFPKTLDRIEALANTLHANQLTQLNQGAKIMADFTSLNQSLADLHTEVAAVAANMDKLFADLTAALAAGNQPAIDAATAAIGTEIQNLKDAAAKDPAP